MTLIPNKELQISFFLARFLLRASARCGAPQSKLRGPISPARGCKPQYFRAVPSIFLRRQAAAADRLSPDNRYLHSHMRLQNFPKREDDPVSPDFSPLPQLCYPDWNGSDRKDKAAWPAQSGSQNCAAYHELRPLADSCCPANPDCVPKCARRAPQSVRREESAQACADLFVAPARKCQSPRTPQFQP